MASLVKVNFYESFSFIFVEKKTLFRYKTIISYFFFRLHLDKMERRPTFRDVRFAHHRKLLHIK